MIRTLLILIFGMVIIETKTFAREVTFEWDALPSATGYEIQVAQKADFKEVQFQKTTKDPQLDADLPLGRYFYRVRAIDQKNRPGHWSDPMDVAVTPYSPELKTPKNESNYSYFELPPKLDFEWKPVDGNVEYEIFIYKTTGKKALETKTKETHFSTETIGEGEYMWKLRTIINGNFAGPYGEPRRFLIEKKDFQAPSLVKPIGGEGVPAYRPVNFTWKMDPVVHFTDMDLQKSEGNKDKNFKLPEVGKNLKDMTDYTVPYMEPGEYKWNVRTKEGESTEGKTAKEETFEVRNDLITDGNRSVNFGLGTSLDQRRIGSTTYNAGGSTRSISTKYFPWEGFGLTLDESSEEYLRSPWTQPNQTFTAALALRFGVVGYHQELIFGYRQADDIFADQNSNFFLLTTSGPVVGMLMEGTISRKTRFDLLFRYFKPLSTLEDFGAYVSDNYTGGLTFSWNVIDQFWIHYGFIYEKTISSLKPSGTQDTVIEWETTRFEPIHLGISWEF